MNHLKRYVMPNVPCLRLVSSNLGHMNRSLVNPKLAWRMVTDIAPRPDYTEQNIYLIQKVWLMPPSLPETVLQPTKRREPNGPKAHPATQPLGCVDRCERLTSLGPVPSRHVVSKAQQDSKSLEPSGCSCLRGSR